MAIIDKYKIVALSKEHQLSIWIEKPKPYLYYTDDYIDYRRQMSLTAGYISKPPVADITGWMSLGFGDDTIMRNWFLHGYKSTAIEVFESLPEAEQKEIIWELDEWK